MSHTILNTRAKGDDKALTDQLHNAGFRVIHEPLTDILLRHTERQALERALMEDPDAVLITSRHGVQALALLSDLRDPFLLCVGDATARTAESMGYTRIDTAGGNVQSLIERVLECYDQDSRFLYPCGENVRVDLCEALAPYGMEVENIVLYEAAPVQQLSDTLIEQLKRGQVDGVTLLSQRSSQIWLQLLEQSGLKDCAGALHAFALSDAVADPLRKADWSHIHVAREATLASLVESVDNHF